MLDFIFIPTTFAIIGYFTYRLFELYARRRERMALIDKLSATELKGDINLNLAGATNGRSVALRGGCLLTGIGLGLVVAYFINLMTMPANLNMLSNGDITMNNYNYQKFASIIYGACVLLFGGIGLIAAYAIEVKQAEKK